MTYTEHDLRAHLQELAARADADFAPHPLPRANHDGSGARTSGIAKILFTAATAAAAVAAVIMGVALAGGQRDTPGAGPAAGPSPTVETTPSDLSPTTPTVTAPVSVDDVLDATGNPHRRPAAGDLTPPVTSDQALKASGANAVVGLVEIGFQHTNSDNEALGEFETIWRLSWVVAWEPRTVWKGQPKAGVQNRSGEALVQQVAFVDAVTGEVYAHVQL